MEEGMIPRGSIKMIGETVGTELSDEISIALAKDVEYRIREILQVSKYKIHSYELILIYYYHILYYVTIINLYFYRKLLNL